MSTQLPPPPEGAALRTFKVVLFTGVGVALMAGTLGAAAATRNFVARARSATGQVVRLNAGGSHPQVRFTTAAGEVVDYPQGGMIGGYRVGDAVEVLYDPLAPTSAPVLNTTGALWGFHVMTFLMGAGFVLMAQLARWRPDLVR